jgi:hypothetical protein
MLCCVIAALMNLCLASCNSRMRSCRHSSADHNLATRNTW